MRKLFILAGFIISSFVIGSFVAFALLIALLNAVDDGLKDLRPEVVCTHQFPQFWDKKGVK